VWDILGQLGSAVLAVSLHSFLCTPSLLTGRVPTEKALMTCEHYSWCLHPFVNNSVSVTYPKHGTLAPAMKKINSTLAKACTSSLLVAENFKIPTKVVSE